MPQGTSLIWQQQVDPAVVLPVVANWPWGPADRQYLDSQIRGIETDLVDLLVGGANGSWYTLDPSSASVVAGDLVCTASTNTVGGTVAKATASALASAGSVLGVALVAAAPGGSVKVALSGVVPPSVTGLGASAGPVIATSARCQKVASVSAGEYAVGTVDAQGFLTLNPIAPSLGGSGGGGAGVVAPVRKNANFTIDSTMNATPFFADTTGAALTATVSMTSLPDGFEFSLIDDHGQWSTHALSVTASDGTTNFVDPAFVGSTGAVATTVALSAKRATVRFKYDATLALFQVL